MSGQSQNPWKTISTKEVYENPWIKLDEHQVINPGGGSGIYGKVHFKNRAIGIIPLDKENNTWIVGQYRYVLDEWSWEIPEGGGPLDAEILDSAKRELKEETGLTATQWSEIAKVHLSNSVSDEVGYVFLAESIEEGNAQLDETEADLIIKKLPFQEVLDMVLAGTITDSLSVIGILKLAHLKGF
ncbi:MAG: NUDIX hydrolase [Cyclobacteriaceae bacterium]